MRRTTLFAACSLLLAFSPSRAQSPMPVIVQAVTPAPAASTKSVAATTDEATPLSALLKMLQEMKAANEEALKKQEATLAQLDELEKAAEQIKTYTKRG